MCVCGLLMLSNTASGQVATTREYVIGVGDALDILVWGFPEFSSKVGVRSDGKITLPMLGDVQAAGLSTSRLKATLASGDFIGKYVTNPNITITVTSSMGQITLTVNNHSYTVPRGATIKQLLDQIVPTLPSDPAPNLSAIKILGADGEYIVDWNALQSGNAPGMNIQLEWGDDVQISSADAERSSSMSPIAPSETTQIKTFTREELAGLLKDAPPERLEMLIAMATPSDDGRYTLDASTLSEEQRQQIGEDILARLFPESSPAYQVFSDFTLAALVVNLAREHGVEAYLARPDSENNGLPVIRRAGEGDLLQKGDTAEENIYLQEINDIEKFAILRKGEALQQLPLPALSSDLKLSGIQRYGATRKAFFSKLPKISEKKPMPRGFQEQDTLPGGAKIAQITDEWVLLQRDAAFELLLLRDSYRRSREPETASLVSLAETAEPVSLEQKTPPSLAQANLPPEMLKALPKPLQAMNTFSKVFFATPLIE